MAANRTVIIPPGILDPDQTNVIQIPRALAGTNTPLLVTQARRGPRAQALPRFNDELDTGPSSEECRHIGTREPTCRNEEKRDARKRNIIFNTSPPAEMSNISGAQSGNISATSPPRDMRNVSGRSTNRSNISATSPPSYFQSGVSEYSGNSSNISATSPPSNFQSRVSEYSGNRSNISATCPPCNFQSGVSDYSGNRSNISATGPPSYFESGVSEYSGNRSNISATSPPRDFQSGVGERFGSRGQISGTSAPSELQSGVERVSVSGDTCDLHLCEAPSPDSPRFTRFTSKTVRHVEGNPPEASSFEIEAPEGVDENTFRTLIRASQASAGGPMAVGQSTPGSGADDSFGSPIAYATPDTTPSGRGYGSQNSRSPSQSETGEPCESDCYGPCNEAESQNNLTPPRPPRNANATFPLSPKNRQPGRPAYGKSANRTFPPGLPGQGDPNVPFSRSLQQPCPGPCANQNATYQGSPQAQQPRGPTPKGSGSMSESRFPNWSAMGGLTMHAGLLSDGPVRPAQLNQTPYDSSMVDSSLFEEGDDYNVPIDFGEYNVIKKMPQSVCPALCERDEEGGFQPKFTSSMNDERRVQSPRNPRQARSPLNLSYPTYDTRPPPGDVEFASLPAIGEPCDPGCPAPCHETVDSQFDEPSAIEHTEWETIDGRQGYECTSCTIDDEFCDEECTFE